MRNRLATVGLPAALGLLLIGLGLTAPPVEAGYVVTLEESGPDLIATGSGPIDLTGLTGPVNGFTQNSVAPIVGSIITGQTPEFVIKQTDVYSGFTGPTNFGTGSQPGNIGQTCMTSNSICPGSGDTVGLTSVSNQLWLPVGYISDNPLSSSAIFPNQTFAGIGAIPGTYEWTWGTGANQNFTLHIAIPEPSTSIPEPSTWATMMLGFAGLGFAGYRRLRNRKTAVAV
jgi:hypothetical protein